MNDGVLCSVCFVVSCSVGLVLVPWRGCARCTMLCCAVLYVGDESSSDSDDEPDVRARAR